jgi:protein SCO1/2
VLVAKPNEIAMFCNTVGFGYQAAQNGQFAHPAVAMVITPDGRISKYLYPGPQHPWFPGNEMKSALADASQGKFSASVDALLLICLQYTKSAYSRASMNLMRVSGILTMMILGGAILLMAKRGSHAQQTWNDDPSDGGKN